MNTIKLYTASILILFLVACQQDSVDLFNQVSNNDLVTQAPREVQGTICILTSGCTSQ